MNAESARRILLVRAVEDADHDHAILPRGVRERATAEARKTNNGEALLDARARILCEHLNLQRYVRWFGSGGCLFVAILAGVVLWLLASGVARGMWSADKSINILIVPLLLLFVWNAAYLAIRIVRGLWSLVRRGTTRPTLVERVSSFTSSAFGGSWQGVDLLPKNTSGDRQASHRALLAFGASWLRLAQPLYAARARFALHVAAFVLVAGEFTFVYLKGVAVEFQATWESTWLSAEATHQLLAALLWPATALIGRGLPSAEAIAALKNQPVNAAYWLNLYLAQASIVVFVPRLVFAAIEYFRAWRFERSFPLALDDRYYQNLIHADRGSGIVASVVPYSFHAPTASRDALRDLLTGDLGYAAHIEFGEPLTYGTVGSATDSTPDLDRTTHCVLLFNLAQTPEVEVHGALIAASAQTDQRLAVVVDAEAYRQRLAGEPELARRLESRCLAWTNLAQEQGIQPCFLGLDDQAPEVMWSG